MNEIGVMKHRISSIDLMRGLVMIIMALDHARDFFHIDANVFQPTDLDKTNPILFFTRFFTHYCAPTFVLLSGVSARMSLQRKSKKELSLYLLTRGAWLVLLEVTVVRLGIMFNLYYDVTILQVIFVIGTSMILLSALLYLSDRIILVLGLLIIAGHNLFDLVPLAPEDSGYAAWVILRQTGFIALGEGKVLLAFYPVLPWLGIMMVGYYLGNWYEKTVDASHRQKLLTRVGIVILLAFIVIRLINVYGDPSPWSNQKDWMFTFMSFINVTKYPPSLLYTLVTIGPVLLLLSFMERLPLVSLKQVEVFGRVPMFYYILHFYLLHAAALVMHMIKYEKSFSNLDFTSQTGFGGIPFGTGVPLWGVYIAWISVVLLLYPLCKWYNNYKSTHNHKWLSYL